MTVRGTQYDFLPKNHLCQNCIHIVIYRRAFGREEISERRGQTNNLALLKNRYSLNFFGPRQVGETF
jgi:hypothetical protein